MLRRKFYDTLLKWSKEKNQGAPAPGIETSAASKSEPCRQYRCRRLQPALLGQKRGQSWHPPQTDGPQFELTRRVGSHDQRGQNRPPAANQMLTKHLTKSLTENAHRNKTAGKHRRPTRPFEPDARSHHRNNR